MYSILKQPSVCLIETPEAWHIATQATPDIWHYEDIVLTIEPSNFEVQLRLTSPNSPLKTIRLRWDVSWQENITLLNDHWERGYGDLGWQGIVPEKKFPWYFMVSTPSFHLGYGVQTNPKALCHWEIDQNGITLNLDVRNGTDGVHLNKRTLDVATLWMKTYPTSLSAFDATHDFCKTLCPNPVFPQEPIYGGNNWYYAYGKSSHSEIIADSKRVAAWSKGLQVKPFMVIDDGWQLGHQVCSGGPWLPDATIFPDMAQLAQEMHSIGVRPGIWFRPLLTLAKRSNEETLSDNRFKKHFEGQILDPSHPNVLAQIRAEVKTFFDWGYEMIKYDFSTFDIFGKWGFEMQSDVTTGSWHFYDTEKTTAEIITQLYQTIFEGASGAYLIGCNTIGHLGTGYIHIQRTGDDTSGQEWERTRKMGINTLAFRMPQHKAFYYVDADCVGITPQVSWQMNQQWLEVLAKSQTPLFVSAAPSALTNEVEEAIIMAFKMACQNKSPAIPIDWMQTTCPSRWKSDFGLDTYDWFNPLQKASSKIHSTI